MSIKENSSFADEEIKMKHVEVMWSPRQEVRKPEYEEIFLVLKLMVSTQKSQSFKHECLSRLILSSITVHHHLQSHM